MILKYILLALSASIDALSLGITYGIKKTKMSKTSNIIIFILVLVCCCISMLIGHFLSLLFSTAFSVLLGSSILIILGLYNIYTGLNKPTNYTNFDMDNSNYIDNKEAIVIGMAVAVDASCVSMGVGIIGYISFILPIFMGIFHTFFVNCGNLVAKTTVKKLNVPSKVLSIFSGILLILIGISRILF